jgi:hypothetical protein
MKNDFASVKLRRPFLAWLKREAARRGLPMYEVVEVLVSRLGVRPWDGKPYFRIVDVVPGKRK